MSPNNLTGDGNQQRRGLREGVPHATDSSRPSALVGEGRALIAPWMDFVRHKGDCAKLGPVWEYPRRLYPDIDCTCGLEALLTVSGVPQWHPIETAPKDGTWVLAYSYAIGRVPAFWCGRHHDSFNMVGPWADAEGPFDLRDDEQPTHWLPLPDPPAGSGVAHQEKEIKK